jgi:hypothetical protein
MDPEALKQIVKKAQADPAFFHSLVLDPSALHNHVHDLGDAAKEIVFKGDRRKVLGSILGGTGQECACTNQTCGESCGVTCGNETCSRTLMPQFFDPGWKIRRGF